MSAGTCVNNTSVMMFKKGSFEIGATIYPVAIKVLWSCWRPDVLSGLLARTLPHCTSIFLIFFLSQYDPQFGDAFWNSSKYSMVSYLLRMMTSWALVCNVWYLPAMHQQVCATEDLHSPHTHTHTQFTVGFFFFVVFQNVRRGKMLSSLQTGWSPSLLTRGGWWIYSGRSLLYFWSWWLCPGLGLKGKNKCPLTLVLNTQLNSFVVSCAVLQMSS